MFCFISASASLKADGWAFAGFLGGATTHQNTLSLEQPQHGTSVTLDPVRYDSRSLQSPIYYGYRVTWFARRHFGLEGEFIHPKVFARTSDMVHVTGVIANQSVDRSAPLNSIVDRFSISHGLNFLLFNGVFRYPLDPHRTARWWLTSRVGAGMTIPHAESEIGGRGQEQYERGSPGVHASLGSEIRMSGHLAATMEYKVTTTHQSVAVAGGTIQGRFTSQHVAVGLAWHR